MEILPVVNEKGKVVSSATREDCHSAKKILHPVVHLHVFNDTGLILLQKRPEHKQIQPGKWDTAVGGHIGYGEMVEVALRRETIEEIGIKISRYKLVKEYLWETEIEREYVYVFTTRHNGTVNWDKDEVDDCRLWSFDEIMANKDSGIFTPNLLKEIEILHSLKYFN